MIRWRGCVGLALWPEVVGKEEILIAEQEVSVGHDGVGPAPFAAAVRLPEAAFLNILFWIGFDQRNRALFAPEIEMPIGEGEGSFADAALFPCHLPRCHVQTDQDRPAGGKDMVSDADGAAGARAQAFSRSLLFS